MSGSASCCYNANRKWLWIHSNNSRGFSREVARQYSRVWIIPWNGGPEVVSDEFVADVIEAGTRIWQHDDATARSVCSGGASGGKSCRKHRAEWTVDTDRACWAALQSAVAADCTRRQRSLATSFHDRRTSRTDSNCSALGPRRVVSTHPRRVVLHPVWRGRATDDALPDCARARGGRRCQRQRTRISGFVDSPRAAWICRAWNESAHPSGDRRWLWSQRRRHLRHHVAFVGKERFPGRGTQQIRHPVAADVTARPWNDGQVPADDRSRRWRRPTAVRVDSGKNICHICSVNE